MSPLLDTDALLWWLADDLRPSAPARQAIGDAENPVLVSVDMAMAAIGVTLLW